MLKKVLLPAVFAALVVGAYAVADEVKPCPPVEPCVPVCKEDSAKHKLALFGKLFAKKVVRSCEPCEAVKPCKEVTPPKPCKEAATDGKGGAKEVTPPKPCKEVTKDAKVAKDGKEPKPCKEVTVTPPPCKKAEK
jgi:hypothetical protein